MVFFGGKTMREHLGASPNLFSRYQTPKQFVTIF